MMTEVAVGESVETTGNRLPNAKKYSFELLRVYYAYTFHSDLHWFCCLTREMLRESYHLNTVHPILAVN